jgi:hypothetical protein
MQIASRTTMTRWPISTASSTVASTQNIDQSICFPSPQMLDQPLFGKGGIACLIDNGRRRAKRRQRRASSQAAGDPTESFSRKPYQSHMLAVGVPVVDTRAVSVQRVDAIYFRVAWEVENYDKFGALFAIEMSGLVLFKYGPATRNP